MNARATPLTALAFETVRREASGQLTLVGSISSSTGAEGFPTMVALEIIVVARLEGAGETELEFSYSVPGSDDMRGFSIGISIGAPDDAAVIQAPPLVARIEQAGEVVMKWRVQGESEWQRLKAWQVSKLPATDSDGMSENKAP